MSSTYIRWSLFLVLISVPARATNWTFNHNYGTMKATDTESVYGVSVTSNLTLLSSGFLKKVVSTATGTGAPTIGTTIYGLDVPGLFYIQPPTLTGGREGQMIYSVATGSCPSADLNSLFMFNQWNGSFVNDPSQDTQPVFGSLSWTNSTRVVNVTSAYNVSSFTTVPGFSSYAMSAFSVCASGAMTSAGAGDRGGNLYMTSEGGGYFRSNANHGIIVIPQVAIPNGNMLTGNYAVYQHDGLSSANIKNVRLVINYSGTGVTGNALLDPSTGTTDGSYTELLNVTAINSPISGVFKAQLTLNAMSPVNLACIPYFTSRTVIFCAGQAPGASSTPLNMMFVSDATTFNSGSVMRTFDTDGQYVNTFTKDGSGNIYVGGLFDNVNNVASRGIARMNGTTGALDTAFAQVGTGLGSGAEVTTVVLGVTSGAPPAGDAGQVYVGGYFGAYNGTARAGLARLNTNGSLDTNFALTGAALNTVPSGGLLHVETLALGTTAGTDLGKLYVGGQFLKYNATNRYLIARLNIDGTLDTNFSHRNGTFGLSHAASTDTVTTIAIGITGGTDLGRVYVGGKFAKYDNVNSPNLVRMLTDGTRDTTFVQTGTGLNGKVWAIALDGNKVWVAGDFDTYNGTSVPHIARLTLAGALDTTFSPGTGFNGSVVALAVDGAGGVYAGGSFTTYNGTAKSGIVRLDSNGAINSTFDVGVGANKTMDWCPGHCGTVNGIYVDTSASRVYLAGSMLSYKSEPAHQILRVSLTGTADPLNLGGGAESCTYHDQIGMSIDSRNRVTFIPPMYYRGVYVGGITRMNTSGTLDPTFNPGGVGFAGPNLWGVWGLVTGLIKDAAGRLLVYGGFSSYNGVSRTAIVRMSADGAIDNTFTTVGTGFDGSIFGVVEDTSDGSLVVAGEFTHYNGVAVGRIARLSSTGVLDTNFTFNSGTGFYGVTGMGNDDEAVWALAIDPTTKKIYAGGWFDGYNGTPSSGVIRLNTDGSIDGAFNVGSGFTNGGGHPIIWALSLQASGLYVGGDYDTYNSTPVRGLVRLNTTTGAIDGGFAHNVADGGVYTIAVDASERVYAAGYMYTANGNATGTYPVIRLDKFGVYDSSFDGSTNEGTYLWGSAIDNNGNYYGGGTGGVGHYRGVPTGCIFRLDPATGNLN